MNYVEAPDFFDPSTHAEPGNVVFLAGGITGCPNWQARAKLWLDQPNITVANPRRSYWTDDSPAEGPIQVEWEFNWLDRADVILFWFCRETVQPIALYELGRWVHSDKPLAVGTHPDYKRRFDVVTQLRLARPELTVYNTLEDTLIDTINKAPFK